MISSDTIRGHLDAIILRLIYKKDCYGYEISNEIIDRTNNEFQIKEATLYAVLQRLVKITNLGRAYLYEEIRNWYNARDIINIFMEGLQ